MSQILEFLLITAPGRIILIILFCLFCFCYWYVIPFLKQNKIFKKTIYNFNKNKLLIQQNRNLAEQMFFNPDFKEAWHEYAQTLQIKNKHERSSTPSEVFFNKIRFVDKELHVEFFKHLPGILTGLGIIGTFWEVIQGLRSFHLNGDPTVVSNSVQNLLNNVWHGFLASLIGVGLSVIITVIEKLCIKILYNKIDKLNQTIDNIFDYGYNEENLKELLESNKEIEKLSDRQLNEAKDLKDNLVSEIYKALNNHSSELIKNQNDSALLIMNGISQSIQTIGDSIGASICESLKEPLSQLKFNVETASKGQSESVAHILERMLEQMTNKIEKIFGTQLIDTQQMMLKSTQELSTMQSGVTNAVKELQDSIKKQQELSQNQTQEHVLSLKNISQKNSAELTTHMQGNLNILTEALKNNTNELQQITIASIEKLNSGAEYILSVTKELNQTPKILELSRLAHENSVQQVNITSQVIAESSNITTQAIQSYEKSALRNETMVHNMEKMLEKLSREISLRENILQSVNVSSEKFSKNSLLLQECLKFAQEDMTKYAKEVTSTIEVAFTFFTQKMKDSRGELDLLITGNLRSLKDTIQELEDSLDIVGSKLTQFNDHISHRS